MMMNLNSAFLGHSVQWPLCVTGVPLSQFEHAYWIPWSPTHASWHQNHDSSPYIKEDIGDFMLLRPSCPPFCVHVTDMSKINFYMLNRFLDLKNLCVATKIVCLAHILTKIVRILSYGGHLGRHLEYFNFPNDTKVASSSFNVRTYWRTHLCKSILCRLFFWVAPKIFIWQPDYNSIPTKQLWNSFCAFCIICNSFSMLSKEVKNLIWKYINELPNQLLNYVQQ